MSAANMMQVLWDASCPHLTDEELADLKSTEMAEYQLEHVADVMEGIGCLVNDDTSAGSFQSARDVPALLFLLSSTVRALGQSVLISGAAGSILQDRKDQAAKASARMSSKGKEAKAAL